MNSLHKSSSSHAFTLIELLTVITIIAILMGLLFPAISIVKEQARRAEAKAAVGQIAAAVKQYYTEYGKYPTGSQATGADLTYGEGTSNNELFDILRNVGDAPGKPNQYNPRAIVFFEAKAATSDPARSGIATEDKGKAVKGAYMDPWGDQYRIILDGDYDNVVTVPHTDFASPNQPRTGCAVFSVGKDGEVGSPKDGLAGVYRSGNKTSDDIVTWQ